MSVRTLAASLIAATVVACGASVHAAETSPQGWTSAQRDGWYWASQGSRLLPEKWFRALERSGSTEKLSDLKFLASFGYLPPPAGKGRYPVGFGIDKQPDKDFEVTKLRWYTNQSGGTLAEPWVGMNCSACHTAQVSYKGSSIRVDGAPSLTDFQSFVEAVDASMKETKADSAKWARFAKNVLGHQNSPANRKLLGEAFDKMLAWQRDTERLNATPLRYGYGRVDAFGHIFNKIAMFSGSGKFVNNPSDAPVSFPFLWNIHRQTNVQWNGIAENSKVKVGVDYVDYGAMGRNAGEVIGVFGEVVITPQDGLIGNLEGYSSSVDLRNQDKMESLVEILQPPKWPSVFPPVDKKLADAGRALFVEKCSSCHYDTSKTEATETLHILSAMDPKDRTDIWMACNAFAATMPSGMLSPSQPNSYVFVRDGLSDTVKGALIGKKAELASVALGKIFGGEPVPPTIYDKTWMNQPLSPKDQRRKFCETSKDKLIRYKARPLDGIWATAPYLHNGSVPTLYELLMPAKDRPTSFNVGGREYDPKMVGFAKGQANGNTFLYVTKDGDGKAVDGNSNAGHEYGAAALTDPDRWALVEYLKTL
ncbi:di-heme-cytochrome C peroxidase [Rhizobium leguminosarum]|uniref:di-heme-cytochrome C peroxidase n=1 Tax=Rhizobium leguminosarum TaxID=384 RepID=UPI0021B09084|nr:di-heme-cytochrome C peroxidase [Rhizobium leguminosarum]